MTFSNPAGERRGGRRRAYVRALLDLLGERDPLEVLAELDAWLDRRFSGVPDDARSRRPEAPGKWSAVEVVAAPGRCRAGARLRDPDDRRRGPAGDPRLRPGSAGPGRSATRRPTSRRRPAQLRAHARRRTSASLAARSRRRSSRAWGITPSVARRALDLYLKLMARARPGASAADRPHPEPGRT